MMTPTLSTIAQILVFVGIYGQLYSMFRYKNIQVNPYAFLLFAVGRGIMIYTYYQRKGNQLDKTALTQMIVNVLGLLAIAFFAYKPRYLKY